MNSLKSILRNAIKNRGITFLNILGLTVGFVCSIFLVSWVIHESTYDNFIGDKDKIYRVILNNSRDDMPEMSAASMNGIGPEVTKLFPEIENYTRLHQPYPNSLVRTLDKKHFRVTGYFVDSTFFRILNYPVLEGDPSRALNVKNNIVIAKQLANKCFGKNPVIGKQLMIDGHIFTVSAVIEDVASNSHLQFQYLIPTLNAPDNWHKNKWGGDNCITYLKLNTRDKVELLNKKITDLVYANNKGWEEIKVSVKLQNIKDIPFSTDFSWDSAKKSSKQNILALSGIAFLIMLIACINFANLFTSSALKRKKTTGIKLVNGAPRFYIIKEYLGEVFLHVILSFFCAMILLTVLLPYLNHLSGSVIDISFFSLRFLAISIPMILITILLAGFFPGLYLTRFKLTEVLKNGIPVKSKKVNIQNIMVTAQFVIAIILVFAVIVIHKQVNFLQSKNLGFDKENVLYIPATGLLKQEIYQQRLKDELLKSPHISAIAYRGSVPTIWANGMPISTNPNNEDVVGSEQIDVGSEYMDLININFIAGENVFKNSSCPFNHCIINEKAAEKLKLKPPYIDKVIYRNGNSQPLIVKGVIENINTKSLTQEIIPNVYFRFNDQRRSAYQNGILLFKIENDHSKAIADIQTYWEKEVPGAPFEYWFLDQTYDNLYKSEKRAKEVLSWFTLIALILTSLGLLAMANFIAEQRTKEIGVRKVNGAKVSEILALLNKDFVNWIAIAFVIASPIAWYAMNKWLENFAYKTTLSWWIFALAGVLALGIALLTVSWQSWKAATRNPVEALRHE